MGTIPDHTRSCKESWTIIANTLINVNTRGETKTLKSDSNIWLLYWNNATEYLEWKYSGKNVKNDSKPTKTEIFYHLVSWKISASVDFRHPEATRLTLTTRVEVSKIISAERRCFRSWTFFSADSENIKNTSVVSDLIGPDFLWINKNGLKNRRKLLSRCLRRYYDDLKHYVLEYSRYREFLLPKFVKNPNSVTSFCWLLYASASPNDLSDRKINCQMGFLGERWATLWKKSFDKRVFLVSAFYKVACLYRDFYFSSPLSHWKVHYLILLNRASKNNLLLIWYLRGLMCRTKGFWRHRSGVWTTV